MCILDDANIIFIFILGFLLYSQFMCVFLKTYIYRCPREIMLLLYDVNVSIYFHFGLSFNLLTTGQLLIRKEKEWTGGKSVRKVLNGGGGLSHDLICAATRMFPCAKLISAYGMFSGRTSSGINIRIQFLVTSIFYLLL